MTDDEINGGLSQLWREDRVCPCLVASLLHTATLECKISASSSLMI